MHTWNILCQITLYNLPPILLPPPLSHFHKITNSLAGFGGRWSPFSSPLRIVSQFVCASLGQVRSASGPPPPPLSSPHSHNPTQRCRLSQFRQRSREKLGKSRQQQHSLGPPPPPTNQPPPPRPLYTMSAVRQFVHETSRPKMEFCAQFNYIIIII